MAIISAAKGLISELAKRVPKNQLKQFNKFMELNAKYKARLRKYPEKLPRIDWEDYRTSVRIEAIKMVDEFEKKYEELNKVFDDRVKLDTKKYYDELEKQRAEVQVQVKQYIDESNQRIKAYEAEIVRICGMKPYSSMTIEEFINLRPEHSYYIPHSRKPLFWPHDPDEQIPGAIGIKKPGEGDSGGGANNSHPIKPSDFKGKTEKFEFNAGKIDEARPLVETRAAEAVTAPALAMSTEPIDAKPPPPKQVDAKCAMQVETVKETTQEISSEREKPHLTEAKPCVNQVKPLKSSAEKVAEPKIHIDKPISEEVRRKLDPCNLIEDHHKKEEAAADRSTASSRLEEETQPTERLEEKSRGEKGEQQRKPHPCDLVKKTKDPIEEKVHTCKTILEGSHVNEKKDSRVFYNPCEVTFGLNTNAGLKHPRHTPQKENAVVKSKTTKAPKEPTKQLKKQIAGPKEPGLHIEKKVETCAHGEPMMVGEDSCKSAASKDPGLHIEKKVESCARRDTCKSGSSVEVKPIQTKNLDSKTAKTKSEPKPSTSCDLIKKKPVVDKDISKSAPSKERGLHIEKNVETCAHVEPMMADKNISKSATPKERGLHIEKNVETCGSSVEVKPIQTKPLDSKTAKPKSEPKPSSSCQTVAPKKIKSQSCVKPQKPMMDHSKADVTATMSKRKNGGSCAPTPYYNPFRSEEENRQKEEEACDECKDEDPCTDDKRRPKTAYYNPFKDDKKKK